MRSDAHKLMHRTERTDHGPFLYCDMAGERSGIDEHHMIADEAVVPDMRIGHDENVAADAGDTATFRGTAVDGDAFADDVVVTHLQPRYLAREGHVLRVHPHHGEGIDLVVPA